MNNECCAKCRYFHRLKHNFKVGEGFEESYCCDVLLHLPKDESEGRVDEVEPQDICEMYKEKDHIADADKMIEPTTKNCRSCRNFGSHHGICEICKDNKCWTEIEPTIKNDSCGEQMDFPDTFDEFAKDYGFRDKKEIYTNGSELIPVFRVKQWLEHISTTKNDLAVDCISRADAIKAMQDKAKKLKNEDAINGLCGAVAILFEMPSVTPQEPQSFKWCTDCKEYDQEKHCCHRYSKVIRDTVVEIRQEPKTGQWIIYNYPGHECVYCSSCKEEYYEEDLYMGGSDFPKYCPNCGCRMVEPQESEV